MTITLASTPDTTAPTFPSSDTFNVYENTTLVGNITTSELATITIFSGDDYAKFSFSRVADSATALSFVSAPNYEAPTDVGANNTYVVVFKVLDSALNVGYETVTVTVNDVVDTSSFNSLALSGTAMFRSTVQITANITVSSKVTFMANNFRIAGCIKKATSGSSPNIIATCNWKPSQRGSDRISASATLSGAGISSSSSLPMSVFVVNRTGPR